jgi:hypothetical protein
MQLRLVLSAILLTFGQETPATRTLPAAENPCPGQGAECRLFPRAKSVEEAFLHLQTAVGGLNERALFDPAISPASRAAVHAQINELQQMFTTAPGEAAQADYIENLDATATALILAAGEPDAQAANATLDIIQRDLQLKLASARATMRAQGGKPKTIPVTIVTRRGMTPVSGYRIMLAEGLKTRWPPTIRFEQLTNPSTKGEITPGVYLAYAYKNDAVHGREMVDIGQTGAGSATLDLQVN